MNREEWLQTAGKETARILSDHGAKVPDLYVSVGFPKGQSGRKRAIGQCWDGSQSEDGRNHIFVCPTLSDASEVLGVLVHEQIHAAVGVACKHKGEFIRVAKAVGLLKPWTATTAGPELAERLNAIIQGLGPYPHSPLALPTKSGKGSRLRLWECGCGVKARVASDDFSAVCGLCNEPFEQKQ